MPSTEFPAAACAAAIAAYRKKISSAARRLGVDPEDVEQDLTASALEAWPRYQEARASPRTFIDRVVRTALVSLVRHGTAQKRSRAALLADGEAALLGVPDRDGDRARAEARMCAEEILAVLRDVDRDLCRDIATTCVAAAALRSGLSRQQVYRRLSAIEKQNDRPRGQSRSGPRK
ncbi:MAG: sigma-70 family RNA polymerase sigma factor [Phycisphaerales bacterium]|nr:sigma-70 family RNA polymerase sigma factor [Phycisphaerales bacterium]